MKQTRAFLGIQSIITHWVTLRTMCRCPSSSRSGDGSAKGSLLIIGDSLATAWHSPTLSAGHQTGTETKQGGLRHFSFNRKSLLLPFSGVCSRLYSREIHLEMSSG